MRKKILGVNIDFEMSIDEVVSNIDGIIRQQYLNEGNRKAIKSQLVATTNPYFIMAAQEDELFKNIINEAVLSVPDGVGTLYANYYLNKLNLLKNKLNSSNRNEYNRTMFALYAFIEGIKTGVAGFFNEESLGTPVTGVALTYRLCELANNKNYTIFLLGGSPRNSKGQQLTNTSYDMASHAADVIKSLYPNVRIVGASSAYSREKHDDNNTLAYIHKCMAYHRINSIDILLVAYNPISQEKWIHRNANLVPAKISLGIGRTFDYMTNNMRPPNPIYEKLHIAWLYTLIKQPWRYKRVFMTFPTFPLKVYKDAIKED